MTGDGAPLVLPAVTALGGEAVVPCRHVPTCELDRSILIDRDTSRIEARLMAWRADLVREIKEWTAREAHEAAESAIEMAGWPPPAGAIPHTAVQAQLAQRAYAADAPLLYAVWKAAQRVREAEARYMDALMGRGEHIEGRVDAARDERETTIEAMIAILADAEREPADPSQPCPHCATAEQARDVTRATLAQVMGERDAATARADRAEAKLATIGAEIDALHARYYSAARVAK